MTAVDVFAHRGFAADYPENTLAALRAAGATADGIELDAQQCRSGEVVVIHDESLDRLTGTSGTVADTDWETLRELDVLDSGERIPLLSEAFEVVPDDVTMNVELKADGIADAVSEVCERFDHEVVVSSFSTTALEEASVAGDDTLGFLFTEEPEAAVRTAVELGCEWVHPEYRLCLETDVLERAHDRGLGVRAWTVNDQSTIEELDANGVDAVITDREALADAN
ncbi:glycerophosphodiester phosphodiesterase family protein [Haloarculaceae archaeon H-GB2-1]|nr:glycerophosphodiester phosphodiesterase family protein [Haloarculaceae archaeon H-GB2-1]